MLEFRIGGRAMKLLIKYYAKYREVTGKREEEIVLESATVEKLLEILRSRYPGLRNDKNSIIAVNSRFSKSDDLLSDGDVISVFPPVSGG